MKLFEWYVNLYGRDSYYDEMTVQVLARDMERARKKCISFLKKELKRLKQESDFQFPETNEQVIQQLERVLTFVQKSPATRTQEMKEVYLKKDFRS